MERPAKIADKGKGQASSQPKAADVIKRAAQHAEQSDRRNEPQADQRRTSSREKTSSSKDSKIKQEKHSASGRNHGILEVRQAVWQQKPSDRVVSPSRQRRPSDTRRDGMSRSSSTSHLGERRWEAGGQKEIPVLAGGGDPDDSSSQQQESHKEFRDWLAKERDKGIASARSLYKIGYLDKKQAEDRINSSYQTYSECTNTLNERDKYKGTKKETSSEQSGTSNQ